MEFFIIYVHARAVNSMNTIIFTFSSLRNIIWRAGKMVHTYIHIYATETPHIHTHMTLTVHECVTYVTRFQKFIFRVQSNTLEG